MIHFANVQRIFDLLSHLISDTSRGWLSSTAARSRTGIHALKRLTEAEHRLQQAGISICCGIESEPLELIQRSELGKTLGRSRMHFNLEQPSRVTGNGRLSKMTSTAKFGGFIPQL